MTDEDSDAPLAQTWFARLRQRLRKWRHALLPSHSYRRLEYMLPVFRIELEVLTTNHKLADPSRNKLTQPSSPRPGYEKTPDEIKIFLENAEKLLGKAQAALNDGNPELGWRNLNASSQWQIYCLARGELETWAGSILREASDSGKAITPWRKDDINDLLADGQGKLRADVTAVQVVRAAKVLNEHQTNVYHKMAIIRGRLTMLAGATLVALLLWLVISPRVAQLALPQDLSPWRFWLTVVLAGCTGAIISGFITSLRKEEKKSRIPLELGDSTITFARLALGALSALAVTVFLSSGILNLDFHERGYELALAVALVSGFTERLILRAVEAVAK